MTATARKIVNGLSRERLLEFANDHPDGDTRGALIDLAGKWKHNWVPLDEIAAAIKAKRMKGDGIRRPSTPDVSASRPAGKTRFDPKGAAKHSAIVSGSRSKGKPPAGAAVAQAKADATRAERHASSLYDRHIGSRPESAATPAQLREVARAHEAADAAHHAAGSPSRAEWHRTEANRLHAAANAQRPSAADLAGPAGDANREAAIAGSEASTAARDARHAQIRKEIKVKKEIRDGRVHFVASHSNGTNTVSMAHPQAPGVTDAQHRKQVRDSLHRRIISDQPGRRPGSGPDAGAPGGDPNMAARPGGALSPERVAAANAAAGQPNVTPEFRDRLKQRAESSRQHAEATGVREPATEGPRGVKATHPVGAPVLASQPGIDRETRGHVTGHTDNGMVKVQYANHRGEQAIGTFNPHHTRVLTGQQAAEHDFQHGGPTAAPGRKPTGLGLNGKPIGENAPSVRGSTQADRDKAHRAQTEAQTAAAISTLGSRDMADLRRLAESKAVKPKVRKAALAELRKRETPEQTAERIGMTFPKPTVKGHALIGEGTVEAPAPTGEAALKARARGATPEERAAMPGPHGEHRGDVVTLTNDGTSGPRRAVYEGRDVNGNPLYRGPVNGQMSTSAIGEGSYHKIEPAAKGADRHADLAKGLGAPVEHVRAHPQAANDLHAHGFKYGDTVEHTGNAHGTKTGQWKVTGLARNGQARVTDTKFGTSVDMAPGEMRHAGKAEAAAEPAAPKKARKPSALHQEYRDRRAEQDRRFEAHTGGGVAAQDTHTQEYKDYFGVGDHSTSPQEQRLTFKSFLEERRQGAEYERRQQQAYDAGVKLGAAHGDFEGDTSSHDAEYQHASAGHDEEMFGQGYSDGIQTGAARLEQRQKDNARKMAELEYGRTRDVAAGVSKAAVTEAGHRAAVHAHVAVAKAALAAGRRPEAQHHIAKAQEHKGHADRLAGEAQAVPSPPAGETRRLERNQSIVVGGPNAGQVREGTSTATAGSAVEKGPGDASRPAAAGITVEHSGDGTLVHGTERSDTETTAALKAQGFKWSRNLNAWYLPRTWGESTREVRVRGLEARLGDKITVQRGPVGSSKSAAEQAQSRIDRANELARRHTDRAGQAAAEASNRFDAADKATAGIPFGQPILMGHHSQRRHERALETAHRNMGAGVEAHQRAQEEARRAESSAATARMQTDPRAAARRLARNEAELRKVERRLNGTGKEIHGENHPATGEYRDRLAASQAELRDKIAHDRGIAGDLVAEGAAATYGRHNIQPGDVVHVGGSAHVVHSTGPKNTKVMTEVGPLPYAYTQVKAVGKLDDVSTEALRKLLRRHAELGRFNAGPSRRLPPAVISRIEAILRDRGESTT